MVRTFMNPLAGVVRVPVKAFTVSNILGGLLWADGLTLLGYALGRVVPIDRYLLPITLVIVAVSAIPVLREYRSGRRAARPRG
ncbi:hypothetical protein MXD61_15790 [Frankia sp. AgPm24]|uniref:DedA family protein n=1 Tax=Frankia sp. AgPm24 TaxID=631128 RepID=UPI002010680B|nr:hypothetical protein [Frankia sp. AgPm24]MCK9923316.1 hypothetical protein [Frankia sp. AgPm24]